MRRLARRDRRAGPRGRGRRRARACARRQDPRPGRRGGPGAARDRRLLGRQRDLGERRAAAAGRSRSRTRRSATSAARCAGRSAAGPTRRGSTGATRWRCGALESRAALGHRRQRRDLRHAARDYLVVDPIMGHDLSFPFNLVKRGWRAVYAPQARASEKMVPTLEGEFARKRRMMGHTWPIVRPRRDALAARLQPPVRAHDRLAPRAAVLPAVPAPDRARDEHRAARGAAGSTPSRSGSSSRCWRRRWLRRRRPEPPAADRAVLRPDDRVAGRRVCGTGSRAGTPAGWEPAEGTR